MKKNDLQALAQPGSDERESMAKELGMLMRRQRRSKEMTLEELGRKCRLSIAYLCDIEHGRRWPTRIVAAVIEAELMP